MSTVSEQLDKRLPPTLLLTVTDVAVALNFGTSWVYGKIEDGTFAAINCGSGKKSYYKIDRQSVLRWAEENSTMRNG